MDYYSTCATNRCTIAETEMTADPGADISGINTDYAINKFDDWIQKEHRGIRLFTASGKTALNEFVTLTFVRKDNCIWSTRFYLADINLLQAFVLWTMIHHQH